MPAAPSSMIAPRFAIVSRVGEVETRALEPTAAEVDGASPELVRFYNDPENRRMLGHEADMTEREVGEFYALARTRGDRTFLLYAGGRLVGDADLRGFDGASAEFAILIGDAAHKGRGLGRHFATLLHAFAFDALALERVYVAILGYNEASLRLFRSLGHALDPGAAARAAALEPNDVLMSVDRRGFERARGTRAARAPAEVLTLRP